MEECRLSDVMGGMDGWIGVSESLSLTPESRQKTELKFHSLAGVQLYSTSLVHITKVLWWIV